MRAYRKEQKKWLDEVSPVILDRKKLVPELRAAILKKYKEMIEQAAKHRKDEQASREGTGHHHTSQEVTYSGASIDPGAGHGVSSDPGQGQPEETYQMGNGEPPRAPHHAPHAPLPRPAPAFPFPSPPPLLAPPPHVEEDLTCNGFDLEKEIELNLRRIRDHIVIGTVKGPFDVYMRHHFCQTVDRALERKQTWLLVCVDSPGGEVHELLLMLDKIDFARAHGMAVVAYVVDMAASCAQIFTSYCCVRIASHSARMMVHEVAGAVGNPMSGAGSKISVINVAADEMLRVQYEALHRAGTRAVVPDMLLHSDYNRPIFTGPDKHHGLNQLENMAVVKKIWAPQIVEWVTETSKLISSNGPLGGDHWMFSRLAVACGIIDGYNTPWISYKEAGESKTHLADTLLRLKLHTVDVASLYDQGEYIEDAVFSSGGGPGGPGGHRSRHHRKVTKGSKHPHVLEMDHTFTLSNAFCYSIGFTTPLPPSIDRQEMKNAFMEHARQYIAFKRDVSSLGETEKLLEHFKPAAPAPILPSAPAPAPTPAAQTEAAWSDQETS